MRLKPTKKNIVGGNACFSSPAIRIPRRCSTLEFVSAPRAEAFICGSRASSRRGSCFMVITRRCRRQRDTDVPRGCEQILCRHSVRDGCSRVHFLPSSATHSATDLELLPALLTHSQLSRRHLSIARSFSLLPPRRTSPMRCRRAQSLIGL